MTNLQKKAMELYRVEQEIKTLQEDRAELREYLAGRIGEDETVVFDSEDGPMRVKNTVTETRILKDPELVLAAVGMDCFLAAAKISVELLDKAVKEVYVSPEEIMKGAIRMIERKTCLKLLKGRG